MSSTTCSTWAMKVPTGSTSFYARAWPTMWTSPCPVAARTTATTRRCLTRSRTVRSFRPTSSATPAKSASTPTFPNVSVRTPTSTLAIRRTTSPMASIHRLCPRRPSSGPTMKMARMPRWASWARATWASRTRWPWPLPPTRPRPTCSKARSVPRWTS